MEKVLAERLGKMITREDEEIKKDCLTNRDSVADERNMRE